MNTIDGVVGESIQMGNDMLHVFYMANEQTERSNTGCGSAVRSCGGIFDGAAQRSWASVVLCAIAFSAALASAQDDVRDSREPVPDAKVRESQRREISSVFDLDKAQSRPERAELSKQLLATAEETPDNPPQKFMLLELGREFAAKSGQLAEALATVDQMEQEYAFHGGRLRVISLRQSVGASGVPLRERAAFAGPAKAVIQQLVAQDRYSEALDATEVLSELARKVRDRKLLAELVQQRKDLKRLSNQSEAFAAAKAALVKDADDPAANLLVGRILALAKGDWNAGLPLLAKGADRELAELAKAELSPPSSAPQQYELAEKWWAYANANDDTLERDRMLSRAAGWYQKAQPKLAIFSRAKAKRRIAELAERGIRPNLSLQAAVGGQSVVKKAPMPILDNGIVDARWAGPQTLDLLAMVQLPRDQIRGQWKRVKTSLHSPEESFARVRLPIISSDDYELRLKVEPLGGGAKNLVVMLSGRDGSRFAVQFEGHKNFDHSGLERIDGKHSMANKTNFRGEVLKQGQVNDVVITVRGSSIRAVVNGREIVNWQGDFGRLSVDKYWRDPGQSCILLGAFRSRMAFHSAMLTTTSPKLAREQQSTAVAKGKQSWRASSPPSLPARFANLNRVYLDDYPETSYVADWGALGKRGHTGFSQRSSKAVQAILLNGSTPSHSLSAHPSTNGYSRITYTLDGRYRRFQSQVSIGQDPRGTTPVLKGTLSFRVFGDGKLLAEAGGLSRRGEIKSIQADLTGVKTLSLVTFCEGESYAAWAVWVEPRLEK